MTTTTKKLKPTTKTPTNDKYDYDGYADKYVIVLQIAEGNSLTMQRSCVAAVKYTRRKPAGRVVVVNGLRETSTSAFLTCWSFVGRPVSIVHFSFHFRFFLK